MSLPFFILYQNSSIANIDIIHTFYDKITGKYANSGDQYLGNDAKRIKELIEKGFIEECILPDESAKPAANDATPAKPDGGDPPDDDADEDEKEELKLVKRGGAYYDVVKPNGEKLNNKALKKKAAEKLIFDHNARYGN